MTVSKIKVTFWEPNRPEVRALYRSTLNGKTLEGGLVADADNTLPGLLVEEHRADGSFYSRGLAITSFGWNPELYDVEWVELSAFEYREAPSPVFLKGAAPEATQKPR